jgi:23S rRNA pseudouridine955/2504/2580 synthase
MAVQEYHITEQEKDMRLDRVLRNNYSSLPYHLILKLIRKGEVRVNGKRAKPNDRVEFKDVIRIPPQLSSKNVSSKAGGRVQGNKRLYEQLIKSNIIHKGKMLLAINKPAGLAVQGGSKVELSVDGLLNFMEEEEGARPYLVHRLDKDTSGVLLLARNRRDAASLTEAFKERTVEKCYVALVVGTMPASEGEIDQPLLKKVGSYGEKMVVDSSGKKSLTHYRVLDTVGDVASLVAFYPLTGRKHQLRVHSAYVGCPIVGDQKYAGSAAILQNISNKLHLHAYSITMEPDTYIEAPLPKHLKESTDYLGLSFL